ncbi:glycosyltransferase family 2 protein [Cellulomonas aerilata]|uniref:Glycosyl transferase n=1 Tax=Cellulomonas aerilata TaxID=515326 RepID=A0A512DDG9_9CELL|nr:glycosyltransferase family 2 protein [Cellulomonas aerilata]GEO34519.1 glycosyl transferase [Cellulomonas aerilata]
MTASQVTAQEHGRRTISIALCTYDGMPYVVDQVRSILEQTMPPDEVVLADDGSADGTVDAVREAVRAAGGADVRLRVVEAADAPLGVAANFERAIAACSGDLILLADQDDVWRPHKIERLVRELDSDPSAVLVASNARLVGPGGEPLGRDLFGTLGAGVDELRSLSGPEALAVLLRGNVLPGMTFLFVRALADRALPIPPSWPHDSWLAVVAATAAGLRVVDDVLVDYRQHGRNVVGVQERTPGYLLRRLVRSTPTAHAKSDRMRALLARLPELDEGHGSHREEVRGSLAFHVRRARLRRSRLLRAGPVARLVLVGSYTRYARNGRLDAVRDLLATGPV